MSLKAEEANHQRPIILLTEDSEDDAYFFQRTLKKTGLPHSLVRARNGKIAIEHLRQTMEKNGQMAPDMIFLDLKMPVMTGFEVLEWMKAQSPTLPWKVIVLSGSSESDDLARASELGATDYLVKPVTVLELKKQFANAGWASGQP